MGLPVINLINNVKIIKRNINILSLRQNYASDKILIFLLMILTLLIKWITGKERNQCVVCHLSCGIVCYVYLNPKIKRDKLGDIMEMLTHYSQKENFLGVIGDLNIRSEFGLDTSTKLLDIFQKLGVKSVFKSVTHNLDGQLDYVLMKNDIPSNKYLAGPC